MYNWCKKEECLFENDKILESLDYLNNLLKSYKRTGLLECQRCRKNCDENFTKVCQKRLSLAVEMVNSISGGMLSIQKEYINKKNRGSFLNLFGFSISKKKSTLYK